MNEIRFTYTGTDGAQLILEQPLNIIMGFTDTVFANGTYTNDAPPDLQRYKSITFGETVGRIRQLKTIKINANIEQIRGKPLASEITAGIVDALDDFDIESSFVVRKNLNVIEFDIQDLVKVKLSKFLNEYLGLDANFIFEGTGSVKITKELVKSPEVIETEKLLVPEPKSCSKILVLCSLCENQVWAGRLLPILAVIQRDEHEHSSQINFTPSLPLYKATSVKQVSQITISLRDDRLEYLPFSEEPTAITISVKRKQLL